MAALLVTGIAGNAQFIHEQASIGVWATKHWPGGNGKVYKLGG
jgi:hypothetical protein